MTDDEIAALRERCARNGFHMGGVDILPLLDALTEARAECARLITDGIGEMYTATALNVVREAGARDMRSRAADVAENLASDSDDARYISRAIGLLPLTGDET